jgi:hypothetical protein
LLREEEHSTFKLITIYSHFVLWFVCFVDGRVLSSIRNKNVPEGDNKE